MGLFRDARTIAALWKLALFRHFTKRAVLGAIQDVLLVDDGSVQHTHWRERIRLVCECPDNGAIIRQPGAGTICSGALIMHNGLRVSPLGHYGYPMLSLLMRNKGVHEPQQEKVFQQVLPTLRRGAVMIELGAYWSFYSLWFATKVPGARNFMIEPSLFGLASGRANFAMNNADGRFVRAYVGARSGRADDGVRVVSVDDFVQAQGIDFVDVLHADIDTFEFQMLQGAASTIAASRVGYIFLSTHTNELHSTCLNWLVEQGFVIIAAADINETYSEDGLIVARSGRFPGLLPIQIALRSDSTREHK